MAVIEFKKLEEPEILFGIKLPEIVKNLAYEIKNKERLTDILKETFNIKKDRYVKIVSAKDLKDRETFILVIFEGFYTKRSILRYDFEIEDFNFKIYEFDYNLEIDVENIIEHSQKRSF